jgi:hypothetical protein
LKGLLLSKKDLVEARVLLERAQRSIPWGLSIACALGMALPVGAVSRSSYGVGLGLLLGLSIGLGLSYAALAVTNSIIAILNHLAEDDSH